MKIKSKKKHWTERSIKDYLFRIVADFITQLETKMESPPISQDEYAKKLGVTKGRVSQLLNHPGNFKLENIIKYARALGMKVSVIAYDDNDPQNTRGPINSEIFKMCWEQSGKPRDFWAFDDINKQAEVAANLTINVIHVNVAVPFYLPISIGQITGWNFENVSTYYVEKTVSTQIEIKDQDQLEWIQ